MSNYRIETLDLDDLQDGVCVEVVRGEATPRTPRLSGRAGVDAPAKTRCKFDVECDLADGSWVCGICIRSGKDLRKLFCFLRGE